MIREVVERTRAVVDGSRALEDVRALAGFHRVQASPGYNAAADWLAESLESAGLVPEITTVSGDGRSRHLGALMPEGWSCEFAEAWLVDATGHREKWCDYEAQKLSLVLRSIAAQGRYPIVDGDRDDAAAPGSARGAVVLTESAVQTQHERYVQGQGAAGLLAFGRRLEPPVRTNDTDLDAVAYTSFWWDEHSPRGWGFAISPARGRSLRSRLAAGERLWLEIHIVARFEPIAIPLLSAVLPGASPEGGEILIVSHLCHPQPSANDNASGAASNLETARSLQRLRQSGAFPMGTHGVRFLWVPEFTGTYAWLATRPERSRRLIAGLNLDMVGERQNECGSVLLLEHPPCFGASFAEELVEAARRLAVDWIDSFSGPGHYSHVRMAEVPFSGGSDHAVFNHPAIDVPCPLLIQWPDRYYHSTLDTPDRCDPSSLAHAARTAATFAAVASDGGPEALDRIAELVRRPERRGRLRPIDRPDAREEARHALREDSVARSLERLGCDATSIRKELRSCLTATRDRTNASDAHEAWRVVERETTRRRRGAGIVFERRLEAPLHDQRFLLPGWTELPAFEREAWLADEARTPNAHLHAELAWMACDGFRNVEEIADLVWLETGQRSDVFIERFFDRLERLELARSLDPSEPKR
ncbi:MAG: DUF4910 domain-containing protein [Candidatus Eisenbacteria bacterium]|uniref:DUF4910 domain-containing protein n=1 Tax=Eiseniibacteriota bacterium TaxID=2212470 RepID=A0A849SQ62_UNCEI|nr:DUF4910 domain-containing protein [Candidatus Eisenbacteria bacterium]